MSLPQTVYFSISNFFYKLTQPTVHVCNAVGVDDFHWLRICILLQLKLKLVSLIYSKLLFKTFWQFKFRCQYSSWVTHSKCMCKIVHYVYLHIVLRKQNSGVYSMKNSPIESSLQLMWDVVKGSLNNKFCSDTFYQINVNFVLYWRMYVHCTLTVCMYNKKA